jgi:hypothetical protein
VLVPENHFISYCLLLSELLADAGDCFGDRTLRFPFADSRAEGVDRANRFHDRRSTAADALPTRPIPATSSAIAKRLTDLPIPLLTAPS